MISLQGVEKIYQKTVVLKIPRLEIPAEKTTALIGPSGCGKSTLLRLLLGLIDPERGEIRVLGIPVRHDTLREIRLRTGYVTQESGLFPHLTVRQNVSLRSHTIGQRRAETEARILQLCEKLQLAGEILDRFPAQLSGGQKQRVSLMRALMLDPDVLLLDEPMGALDPLVRHDLQDELREIFRRLRKTVVLVTHDFGEAAFLGDIIVLLNEGQIVQQGSAEALVQKPANAFVTRFIQAQRSPWEGMAR